MKSTAHVQSIVVAAGGTVAIARAIGISPAAVSKWIARGEIPLERVPVLERLTGIRRHIIRPDRPDFFPPPKARRPAA